MAMKLKNREEITEDGVVFVVETYSNGKRDTVVKYKKPDEISEAEEQEIPLSEQEQIAIDTALNVEYIACLMESGLA